LFILSSTKLEIRAEQFLPGREGGRKGRDEREGARGRGEKGPKHCMHI
jgi:hypothetical protein